MFEVWLQMSDTNFDRKNPSDLPALISTISDVFIVEHLLSHIKIHEVLNVLWRIRVENLPTTNVDVRKVVLLKKSGQKEENSVFNHVTLMKVYCIPIAYELPKIFLTGLILREIVNLENTATTV